MMSDGGYDVVLKGEIHTSQSDLDEERQLLVNGVDTLVIEGQRGDAEYGVLRSWYAAAIGIVGLVLFNSLYVDHSILTDLAKAQDATVKHTRESNAVLVENAHPLVELVAAVVFYGVLVFSIGFGLQTGNTLYGAVFLLGSALIPIFVLRQYEISRQDGQKNRDQIIADLVADSARESDRVVAIMGGNHLDPVAENLPEDISYRKIEPTYSIASIQHAREVLVPAFTAWSVLFVLYLAILSFFRWLPLVSI